MANTKGFRGFHIGNLAVKLPLVQGGMAVGISLAEMAAVVADAGGIGVIAATGIGMNEQDFEQNPLRAHIRTLRRELKKAKELSHGIIGINVMMVSNDCFELMHTAKQDGADIIFMGAGLPVKIPVEFFETGTYPLPKLVPILSSAKAVQFVLSYWEREYKRIPDAFVIEGPLAGGHLGFKKDLLQNGPPELGQILTDVLEVVREWEKKLKTKIPVICGGGIFDGHDIKRMLSRGASAVQMATRFAAAVESAASPEFKKAYLNCTKNDIVLIDSPVGMPGRAIMNSFLREVRQGYKKPFRCVWQCIKTCDIEHAPYCIARCMMNAKLGRLDEGFVFCGANAYKVDKILSVNEIIQNLKLEYEKAGA